MTPRRFDPADLAGVLPPGGTTLVQGCSAESRLLAGAVVRAGEALGAMTFTGIQVPGVNRVSWLGSSRARFTTFFMTPQLRAAGPAVTFLSMCYAQILAHLRATTIDAALFSVSPPDENGMCSFGPTVDFLADLWPGIPRRIAHINPLLPRTYGPTGIPFDALTAVVEAPEAIPETADHGVDPVASPIAGHVARFIGDGSTIQTGLGKLPGAILRSVTDRRGLRIHSGLIGDAVLDLLDAGAIDDGRDVVAGVAIGTRRLYDALPDAGFRFHPVSYTHDAAVLGAIPDLVTINSALDVDLYGQAFAELAPDGWHSGPGGAGDFARGAMIAQGLRIVALPSQARGASRIVAPGAGRGPVSLGRADIDLVVTEHGVADLRRRTHDERASALIAVADPAHREALTLAWRAETDRR